MSLHPFAETIETHGCSIVLRRVEGPVARELFRLADRPERRVRLVGVTAASLRASGEGQLSLFSGGEPRTDERIADAVDELAERFGRDAITRAALLDRGARAPGAR